MTQLQVLLLNLLRIRLPLEDRLLKAIWVKPFFQQ